MILAVLTACASQDSLDGLVGEYDLSRGSMQSGQFTLATVSKDLPRQVSHLRVYIGSDGRPWQNREPASDPTGTRSLAVELMHQDPLPSLYLGRPCYHLDTGEPPCERSLWTSGRYSEVVIASMAQAVDMLVQQHGARRLTLVGYSGGGTVAVLVAARMDPALELTVITVAANLDIDAWTRFHQHLPLTDSLNPVRDVPTRADFRQIHLVGGDDRVVPPATIRRYRQAHPQAIVWTFEGFDHLCCWAEQWPDILRRAEAAI